MVIEYFLLNVDWYITSSGSTIYVVHETDIEPLCNCIAQLWSISSSVLYNAAPMRPSRSSGYMVLNVYEYAT